MSGETFTYNPPPLPKNKVFVKWENDTLYFNDGKDNFIDISTLVSRIEALEKKCK